MTNDNAPAQGLSGEPGESSKHPFAEARGSFDLALALSGGNALGSYQAGAYQALQELGLEPDRVAGASAGAINGAIICGNRPEARLEKLRELWRPSPPGADSPPGFFEEARRSAAALWTLTAGREDIFVPRHLFGPLWNPFGNPEASSLYDTTPLHQTLARLVDFDRLNEGRPRYSATAVDLESGDDVVFDTAALRVGIDHVRASASLLPAFPPVQIGERLLGDAGISANLPLDSILSDAGERPLLCIAVDLLPLGSSRPQTLGETAIRMQDLLFATQSRRAIAAWQALFDERAISGRAPAVTILHLAYSDQSREVSGKAFDFSPDTAAARWRIGYEDMRCALMAFEQQSISVDIPGLSVYVPSTSKREHLEKVYWKMRPENPGPA